MALSDRALQAKLICCEAELGGDLKCSSCSRVAVNCFQTPHGCRLCQDCVASRLDKIKRRICPCTPGPLPFRDEEDIKELLVNQASCLPDTATRRGVSKLTVCCPNSECPEQMEWKNIEKHLNDCCNFELVACDLCDEPIVCRELRTDRHYNLDSEDCCIKYSGYCPLCGDTTLRLSREDFVEHKKSCSKRQIKCKYRRIGCSVVTSCVQMDEHYKDCTDKHLHMTVEHLCCGNRVMDESQADQLNAIRHQQNEQEIIQFSQELKQLMEQMQSEIEQKLRLHLQLLQSELAPKLKADLQELVQSELTPKLKADLQELVQSELTPKLKVDLQELVQSELTPKLKVDLQELVQKEVEDKISDKESKRKQEEQDVQENLKAQELNENLKEGEISQKEQELNEKSEELERNAKQKELKPDGKQEEQELKSDFILEREKRMQAEQELMALKQKLVEMENHLKKLQQNKSSRHREFCNSLNESEEHQCEEVPHENSRKVAHEWSNNSTRRQRTQSTSLF